jgi:membrane peptidoglycan carboxypeptidase
MQGVRSQRGLEAMRRFPKPLHRIALGLGVLAALGAATLAALWVETPDPSDIHTRVQALTKARGVPLLGENDVPPRLAEAVVAIEDERFYQHHGIDSIGLSRALLYDVTNLCLCQGGSTITAQLVKDVYLGGSDRGLNKIVDMVVALKAERVMTKKQILADYLSEITSGFGRYGVTEAACAYFRAPLDDLTLGQYALLAGVTQAPSVYDPTVNPELARQRRAQVLSKMVVEHLITQAQAQAANAEPVTSVGPGC